MSWLQTHQVAIPFYEVRGGKQVFAIQLQERAPRQEVPAHNWSITSTSSQQILQENADENISMSTNTLGVRMTAMRSYSQFRKLWKALTLATKMPSAASLSRYNSATTTPAEHLSDQLLANSFHSVPLTSGTSSSFCRCRNWNCMFQSFHYFFKSYPFPSRFLIKRSTPSLLETRRQGLELFVKTVRKLFDTFPRPVLQSIDALENCQVLMALSVFFGINEKKHTSLALIATLRVLPADEDTGKRKSRRIRSDSATEESISSFSCRTSSQSGVSNCITWLANDRNNCRKSATPSAENKSIYGAGVEYYLQDGDLDSTNYENIDSKFDLREFQQFPVLSNGKYGNDSTSSIDRTFTKYLTSPHRGSTSLGSTSRWIRCSRSCDVKCHTAFLVRNPAIATRSCCATFDTKAPQILLPGLPKILPTSKATTVRSFLEEFKDHLLLDPHALGSSATPMGHWNEERQWELALYVASQIGHAGAVESILCRGPDPDAVMENGLSSLQVACRGSHRSIVAMLLTSGADTNITDPNGVSPLLSSVQLGDLEIVEMLVKYGANVNQCNADSVSAVHVAVACQTLPVLRLLLEHDAFVNTKNDFNGKTPLHLAAQSGSLPMCKLLLNYGASIHHKTARGLHVVDLAKSHGHENIARYCLNFDITQKIIQRASITTTQTAAGAFTSKCSHEFRIVSDDGYAYAVL